ncbi:MAG: hypothetical protein ACYCXY_01640 [Acidimicrobiales bacterium]
MHLYALHGIATTTRRGGIETVVRRTGARTRRRLLATLIAGAAGGVGGAVFTIARKRARKRRERGEQVFSKASAGMWPPVPRAPERGPHIVANRAGDAADGDAPGARPVGSDAPGRDTAPPDVDSDI